MLTKGLLILTEVAGDETTTVVEESAKWFEKVNDWFDKPAVAAVISIAGLVAIGLCVYHFAIKKLLRKGRK